MKHMYMCFWRPDILASLQASNAKQTAICGALVFACDLVAVRADVSCMACRETFLEALPNGSGKVTTFVEPIVETIRAAVTKPAEAGWTTVTAQPDLWKTK